MLQIRWNLSEVQARTSQMASEGHNESSWGMTVFHYVW